MNEESLRHSVAAPVNGFEGGGGERPPTDDDSAHPSPSIGSRAREAATKLKSAAGDTAARAKVRAKELASEQKDIAAGRIGGYGNAIHESARSLENQDPNIAWATHRVADRIQDFSDYVRGSDLRQLWDDAEDLARRHPVTFFGCMFVAGLIAGNLLKARSTAPANSRSASDDDSNGAALPDIEASAEAPQEG